MEPLKKENGWRSIYDSWWNVYTHYGGSFPWTVILTDGNKNLAATITAIHLCDKEINLTTLNGKSAGEKLITPQNLWHIKYGKTAKGKQIFTNLGDNYVTST